MGEVMEDMVALIVPIKKYFLDIMAYPPPILILQKNGIQRKMEH